MKRMKIRSDQVIDNDMGFIREQEIRAAVRFLQWQYEKQKMPPPATDQLRQQAARIVDEAHRIFYK